MSIKITNLNHEIFEERMANLLILTEGFRSKIYSDTAKIPKITIGIGFNIEVEKWRKAILMYKCGIPASESLSNQSEAMQTLINNTSTDIQKKIEEYRKGGKIQRGVYQTSKNPNSDMVALQNDINGILQKHIGTYNKSTTNKLNSNMAFELTADESKEIKKIIGSDKMPLLRITLNKWGANYLTTFSKTEAKNPQEFIPLLSIYYQRPARFKPEKGLIPLKKAFSKKNRFLAWFSIRYYADIRQSFNDFYGRRIQEAAMFRLCNQDESGNIEYFSTSIDIFSYLNFNLKEANTKEGLNLSNKYTYLSFMKDYEQCKTINDKAEELKTTEFNNYHQRKGHYYSYVGEEEFQGITDILTPYLNYINTLTDKTFTLKNIYCIQSFNGVGASKTDNVAALNKILKQRFSKNDKNQDENTSNQSDNLEKQDSKAQEDTQILILYPNATHSPIKIAQPKNTFLTLVVGKNAKLDCSELILEKCEIYYLEYDEKQEEKKGENPKATKLGGDSELTLKTKDSKLYEVTHNNIIYYISSEGTDKGILKIALGEDKKKDAIELYGFAKEREFRILRDVATEILNIRLKLEDEQQIETHQGGNFNLTLNNLSILDKDNKNTEICSKVFLHNCENRRIYESASLTQANGAYTAIFNMDLILNEDSFFFKRTTKCIIATSPLGNLSTSEIHAKGNVAIASLSSTDKKGGSYVFEQSVSMQEEPKGEDIATLEVAYRGEKQESPISLEFNGKTLAIIVKENNSTQKIFFQAVSGKPKKNEITGKYDFIYTQERQMLKGEGPIPEGEYYVDINKISEVPFLRLDRRYGWGNKNIPIELNNQETYGRYGFYIHGGWSAGSAGCIDLWDSNELFFEELVEWSKRLNITKIPLIVKYNNAIMQCSDNLLGFIKQCEAK